MRNRDLQIGQDFMYRSFYDIASLQQWGRTQYNKEREPPRFKIYQNADFYRFDQAPPLTLGDARWSFQEFQQEHSSSRLASQSDQLDLVSLSALLYYTYGFSHHDEGLGVIWPFHRFVPSARCFFPAELYLWLPEKEHFPAGIYHYDNLHHSLALLRPGMYLHLLAQALDADLDDCLCVFFISALFWKNAFHYLDFSYRLSTQEAGLVTGNALLVAGTLGFSAHVHYQFLDQPLNRLLGFEKGEESLLSVVPLYAANSRTIQRLQLQTTEQSLCDSISLLALSYIKTPFFAHELCPLLTEIDQHSFLEETTEIVIAPSDSSINCVGDEERIVPPMPLPQEVELAQALHLRSSGKVDFVPLYAPLTQGAFWEIVRYSLSVYHNDIRCALSPPHLQLYIVVQHVDGIDKGLYRLCSDCNMLHVIEHGDISRQVQSLHMQGNINSISANIVCYIVGNYPASSNLLGNRAYRIAQMETGLIAQRLCVMSSTQGLVSRYSNSYDTSSCKKLLKLMDSPFTPLAELIIGHERSNIHTNHSYRFSLLH